MNAGILQFALFTLVLSVASCSREPSYVTDPPVSIESLKGKWEGMESEGKFKTHVTIGDEFIQIEHVDIPNSMTKDRYQIMTIGSDTVLTIEGTKEPLWLVFDGNQLRFELSQADAMKVSVPMITMLKFRRIEDS